MIKKNVVEFKLVPFLPLSNLNIEICGTVQATEKVLNFEYEVLGDIERLQIATPSSQAERRDLLWKHTCFEVFFSEAGANKYWEVNISSEGHWNWYSFDHYRMGMRPEVLAGQPSARFEQKRERMTVQFKLNLSPLYMARKIQSPNLDLAPAIVLENVAFEHSFWAISHGLEKPDFHRRNGFELKMAIE